MSTISPVVLCGGVGTRLWPMSRPDSPKQFQMIGSGDHRTFFQATVLRHATPLFGQPWVLVNGRHLSLVRRQLRDIQQRAVIIAEPESRNTAPAMAVAALRAAAEDPGQLLLTLPADHLMSPAFNTVIRNAVEAAQDGHIVTFGIEPGYPETGYGYIVDGGAHNGSSSVRLVERFIEKPPLEIARNLVADARSYWASGIALFRAATLVQEFERHAPDILDAARRAIEEGEHDGDCLHLGREAYASARSTSCEYAVIEKSSKLVMAPAKVAWNDVGAWSAFHEVGQKCENGNVSSGDVVLIGTRNSYVRAADRLVTVIGLSDVVVVDTPDALLVTHLSQTQHVKAAVELLGKANRQEVQRHPSIEEDWGSSSVLAESDTFSLRHIHILANRSAEVVSSAARRLVVSVVGGGGEAISSAATSALVAGASYEYAESDRVRLVNTGPDPLDVVEMLIKQAGGVRTEAFGDPAPAGPASKLLHA